MKPYYEDDFATIYHCNWREVADQWVEYNILLTDPPYGINYESGAAVTLPASIAGDADTSERDDALAAWDPHDHKPPALVFGTWRAPRPVGTRMVLVWDTKGALGMGDLSLPWKPSHQEVYVLGSGFTGRRTTDVLTFAPVQAMAANGRVHPHQKPVELLGALLDKCPLGAVADPFMGSGSTLVAAKSRGRKCIGVEIEERYCEVAARRLAQEVLDFGGAA